MGDMGDLFRDLREEKRRLRAKYGVECPQCKMLRSKTNASVLLPQQKCKVDGYVDPRPRLTEEERNATKNDASTS